MATLDGDDLQYRLPADVSPTHYNLTVFTDLKELKFLGTVEIDLAVRNATSRIVLNVADLELHDISLSLENERTFIPISEANDKLSERLTLVFPTALTAGATAKLFIAFSGVITGSMPTAARRAFPSFDEPALKATFAINLIGRSDTVNLSNMPSYSEEPCDPGEELGHLFWFPEDDGVDDDDTGFVWKITRFQTTPVMSTYLVAYANGAFRHLETEFCSPLSGRTVPLRIYTTARNLPHAGFALELTARVLPLYEQIFDIEYPLPKLDTLVVDDFDVFAMENWGLITGRASGYLLTDPSMLRVRKEIVNLQSHETAHMWFGNITTMSWWTYLYLNEGFATLVLDYCSCLEYIQSGNWGLSSSTSTSTKAFSLDSGLSSHPVEVICPDANKINQIFDGLSYSKAAAVLRMLSSFVGEDRFLKGVSLYLKEGLYGNRTTSDLWRGVEQATGWQPYSTLPPLTLASDINVSQIMDAWISKPGFPVVTIEETSHGVHLKQSRFLFTGQETEETLWVIPLQILSLDGSGQVHITRDAVMREREQFFALDTNSPFKINSGSTGYYRVLYSPDRLKAIGAEAAKEASVFSVADRVGLVNDAFALAKADLLKMSDALCLSYDLRSEKEYHVWVAIASNLTGLVSIWWEDRKVVELVNSFRRALFVPLVEMLGYQSRPDESDNEALLRTCATAQALDAGDTKVANELTACFTDLLATNGESKVASELMTAIYTAVTTCFNSAFSVLTFDQGGKARRQALCAADDVELTTETFRFILSEARDQDIMYFIGALVKNIETRRRTVTFFLDNFDEIHERFKDGFGMADLLELTFSSLSTEGDRDRLVTFFKPKDTSRFELRLLQVLDSIEGNCACVRRSTENLLTWLEDWIRR
ncbi:Aminopeptidase 1 [Mycena sanguinolenta]|uniref:Aminopeptidase n=1 Tax=Mycena sanguinolenta TaxID=230812 RepID=A0A8H7CXA9_9AGAR|nr:Aminopeptidase 1 [Mycena sanguinolenta]